MNDGNDELLLGNDPSMIHVRALCARLASSRVPVLLVGETGTGKELAAHLVHGRSARQSGPFVVLDCRSMSSKSLEETLFGDLAAGRVGLIERAHGGTLFVDEPGALDHKAQLTLLRAIDRAIPKDGCDVTSGVRVVSSTSCKLEQLVERGTFRQDLYFRLCGARLDLPPLRRRRSDIPLLAAHFFAKHGVGEALASEFLERYEGHEWPGNVRELALAVERFALLGGSVDHRHAPRVRTDAPAPPPPSSRPLDSAHLGVVAAVLDEGLAYAEAKRRILDVFERAYVEKVLRENDGVVTRAAAASGLARRYFQILRARVAS